MVHVIRLRGLFQKSQIVLFILMFDVLCVTRTIIGIMNKWDIICLFCMNSVFMVC